MTAVPAREAGGLASAGGTTSSHTSLSRFHGSAKSSLYCASSSLLSPASATSSTPVPASERTSRSRLDSTTSGTA
eukprot:2755207-Prymnesium_polylepis.1